MGAECEGEPYDCLELFDSCSIKDPSVRDVLLATSNAPTFFKTPSEIEGELYVDGGVGGNCPIIQAIPRMKKIRKNGELASVLSIAPPRNIPSGEASGLVYWLTYFGKTMTDGSALYAECKKQYPPGTFMRLFPKSESCEEFKTDDIRVDKMTEAMEHERLSHPHYLKVLSQI